VSTARSTSSATSTAAAPGLIGRAAWDDVVLQEWTGTVRAGLNDSAIGALARPALARGAQPWLFAPWADDDAGFEHNTTWFANTFAFTSVGMGIPVVPMGIAWADARQRRPALALHASDGHHPSRAGSFLTACVVLAQLGLGDPRTSTYDGGLDPADAAFLKAVAAEFIP
jgi:hypothetical protein